MIHGHQLFYQFFFRHFFGIKQPFEQLFDTEVLYLSVRNFIILHETFVGVELLLDSLFLVFVERYHLIKERLSNLTQWCDAVRSDRHLYIVQVSNDWLNLSTVNSM